MGRKKKNLRFKTRVVLVLVLKLPNPKKRVKYSQKYES